MSDLFVGDIPDPRYRLHPAIGVRRVEAGEPLHSLIESELPADWLRLTEDEEERLLTAWLSDVMLAVASRGPSKFFFDLSDRRGLEGLKSLPDCAAWNRPLSFICEATPEAIRALQETNPAIVVQSVGSTAYLLVLDNWYGMFLCVEDDELTERFRTPVLSTGR